MDAFTKGSGNENVVLKPEVVPVEVPVKIKKVYVVQAPKPKPVPYIKVRPKRVSFPSIAYPESAKPMGIEGKIRLRLFIDTKGAVYKVIVLKKLHPILDRTAIKFAKKAKYKPAKDQYGNPITATTKISITFRMEKDEDE
jgi:periplasmic protein TonB